MCCVVEAADDPIDDGEASAARTARRPPRRATGGNRPCRDDHATANRPNATAANDPAVRRSRSRARRANDAGA
jgi:hypothetical protein